MRIPHLCRKRTIAGAGLALLLMTGCGLSEPRFSGESRAAVQPEQVRLFERLPAGYRVVGQVTAACHRASRAFVERGTFGGVYPVYSQRYSDLACSRRLLKAALTEQAAMAGGVALTDFVCIERPRADEDGTEIVRLGCRAEVARPASQPPAGPSEEYAWDSLPASRAAGPEAPPLGRVSEAWRVVVTLADSRAEISHKERWREQLPAGAVQEQATIPAGDKPVTDVSAYCEKGCDPSVLRAALRLAAARIGANDVVGVRCVEQPEGSLCVGKAAAYEFDPRRHSDAR